MAEIQEDDNIFLQLTRKRARLNSRLTDAIKDIIIEFQNDTGLTVHSISLTYERIEFMDKTECVRFFDCQANLNL